MRICVYGAASPAIDPGFITEVEKLGRTLAERGHSLVFGGGGNGLMGAAARGFKKNGGNISLCLATKDGMLKKTDPG